MYFTAEFGLQHKIRIHFHSAISVFTLIHLFSCSHALSQTQNSDCVMLRQFSLIVCNISGIDSSYYKTTRYVPSYTRLTAIQTLSLQFLMANDNNFYGSHVMSDSCQSLVKFWLPVVIAIVYIIVLKFIKQCHCM